MSHANGSQGLPFCYLNALQAPYERLPSNSRWFFLSGPTSSLRIVFTSIPVS